MNSTFWNWQDVRVFLAVAREGSTLAAARKLNMSQPTVARRINVLEHETGLTLFLRGTKGFQLTQAGRAILPEAEALEKAALSFQGKANKIAQADAVPIRITAGSMNFTPRFAGILSEFSQKHPSVRFELLPSYAVLDLCKGEADIALRLTGAQPDARLICRKISEARFALYASQRYIDAHGAPNSYENLDGHRLVTFLNENATSRLHEWLLSRVRPEQIVSSCTNVDALVTALQSGLGAGILNVGLADGLEGLVQCCDPAEELTTTQWLLVSPEAWTRPEVKSFVKFFAPRYAAIFGKRSNR